jgi:hypothetical protein
MRAKDLAYIASVHVGQLGVDDDQLREGLFRDCERILSSHYSADGIPMPLEVRGQHLGRRPMTFNDKDASRLVHFPTFSRVHLILRRE